MIWKVQGIKLLIKLYIQRRMIHNNFIITFSCKISKIKIIKISLRNLQRTNNNKRYLESLNNQINIIQRSKLNNVKLLQELQGQNLVQNEARKLALLFLVFIWIFLLIKVQNWLKLNKIIRILLNYKILIKKLKNQTKV